MFVFPQVFWQLSPCWVIAGDKIGVGLEMKKGWKPEPCVGWFFSCTQWLSVSISPGTGAGPNVLEAEALTVESELVLFPPSMHSLFSQQLSRRFCCVPDTHWDCLGSQSRIQTTCDPPHASASSMLPHPIQMRCWVQNLVHAPSVPLPCKHFSLVRNWPELQGRFSLPSTLFLGIASCALSSGVESWILTAFL